MAFAAAAELLLLAQARPDEARALLAELDQVPDRCDDTYYIAYLPGLVRTALALESPELASRLVDGVDPNTPLAEHALRACRAALSEAGGERAEAAALYADAAKKWRAFGDVPECAYALLGQGRCLRSLGDASAVTPLLEARELFASLGFASALAEVDGLLGRSEAAAL
jgi:hypothetical protein